MSIVWNSTEVKEIFSLMKEIENGSFSRNKNFFQLKDHNHYQKFKRAKLLLSLKEDIKKTNSKGNIEVKRTTQGVQLHLYDPTISYQRTFLMNNDELLMLSQQTQDLQHHQKVMAIVNRLPK
ncbi:MAG: hypothetical protein ACI86H_000517 [bacterium]|jgi:hypothetical protein